MKNSTPTKAEKFLKLDYKEEEKLWLTEQGSLRILVGVLGVLLPILLMLFLWIDNGYRSPLESISHYYYTKASGVFIIIVSLLAIFLLIYKGKQPVDFYISAAAGLFALCVVLFPTSNISINCPDPYKNHSVTILKDTPFRYNFHYFSAAIFLLCLASMSLFLFTKSDKPVSQRSRNKKIRNKIYIFCGVMMVLALLVILAGFLDIINEDFYTRHHLTFWMETVAVEFFGLSWLTKAELVLKG